MFTPRRFRRHEGPISALAAINRGDTAAVAHALEQAGYYTAGEGDYARLMTVKKAEIDRTLGLAS